MARMQTATPEEMQAGMQAWMDWFAQCGEALLEQGARLDEGRRLTAAGSSDSPRPPFFCYSLLQAESLAAAQALLESHPHLTWAEGCAIEVYPAV